MSTVGQALGAGIGGAVGFFVGGPMGAVYGTQIGMSVGGYLDPPKGPTMEGPRLSDLSVQTSTYGASIARTYGTIAVSGNMFWLENNKLKEVVKKEKSGGKGGGSSVTTKTYTYFATFAVGLCEGPIAGVKRIWVGNDLFYDSSATELKTILASGKASSGFSLYLGTDDQLPDARMQAEMGAENCPAYRGLSYIVFKDLPLEKYGNSLLAAPIKVELVNLVVSAPKVVSESQTAIDTLNFGGTNARSKNGISTYSVVRGGGAYQLMRYESGNIEHRLEAILPAAFPALQVLPGAFDGAEHCFRSHSLATVTSDHKIAIGNIGESKIYNCGNVAPVLAAQYGGDVYAVSVDPSTGYHKLTRIAAGGNADLLTVPMATTTARGIVATENGPITWRATPSVEMEVFDNNLISGGVISTGYVAADVYSPATYADGYLYICRQIPSSLSATLEIAKIDVSDGSHETFVSTSSLAWSSTNTFNLQYSLRLVDSVLFLSGRAGGYMREIASVMVKPASQLVPLSHVLSQEIKRSGSITDSDIDVSLITDSLQGFKVATTSPVRNATEPLRATWPFDMIQSGYKLKAIPRGRPVSATIPDSDFVQGVELTVTREMDEQIPKAVRCTYLDPSRNYDVNQQSAERAVGAAVGVSTLELPIVMGDAQAAQVCEKLLHVYLLERYQYEFGLPNSYLGLEPGDVVTLQTDEVEYEARLITVNYNSDGTLKCSARANSAATYISAAEGVVGQQQESYIPYYGASVAALLDVPVIDDTIQNQYGYIAGMSGYYSDWPSGSLLSSADAGLTWKTLQAFDGKASFGLCAGTLSAHDGRVIQVGGSLVVTLFGGQLESVTESQMLNGENMAAYGVNGRWEILRFQNATLNGDGSYTVSRLWRGDKGTEWATGLHQANDLFVLLDDPQLEFLTTSAFDIGVEKTFRAVTSGASSDDAYDFKFTYGGANLKPLSGVAPLGVRSPDLSITWKRRTRLSGGWRDGVDVPVGESSEQYEIDVMNASAVVRTISTTTTSAIYTTAQQTADFGTIPATVTLRIYQMSEAVGRGYPLEVTM